MACSPVRKSPLIRRQTIIQRLAPYRPLMKSFRPLLLTSLALASLCAPLRAATDFNEVGKALIQLFQDAHYERRGFDAEINRRILDSYLDELDPERLYFYKTDVEAFEKKFTRDFPSLFDLMLFQEKGIEPALEIYSQYLVRVDELTDYISRITKGADFSALSEKTVATSRRGANYPADMFDAQKIWQLRIADELLDEELRRESLAAEEAVSSATTSQSEVTPITQELSPRETIQKKYERFAQVARDASEDSIANRFLGVVAQAHDPHSDYLSTRKNEIFDREMQNELSGIGVELQALPDGTTRVAGLFKGGPAQRGGQLLLNDRILMVDPLNTGEPRDITFLPIELVSDLISGKVGTSVGLTVINPDDPFGKRKVVIERDTIALKNESASAEIILHTTSGTPTVKMGYIKIPSFYLDSEDRDPSVYRDVERLVQRMNEAQVDGIALDLRGNPGGDFDEAPKIAGLFLPPGPVVQLRDRNDIVQVENSERLVPLFTGPLVVLTDRNSASSSEILAAALQDYNRALIIGESSTFGKGTVQRIISVAQYLLSTQDPTLAGNAKVSVQKFYRVTGTSTQIRGVNPDIIVDSINDALEVGEGFLPYPLPTDTIPPARAYRLLDPARLHRDVVIAASRQRIKRSIDFDYVKEDIDQLRRGERPRPLNRKARIADSEALKEKAEQRAEERRLRFAIQEENDRESLTQLRLTLDDLDSEVLPLVDPDSNNNEFMLRAPDDAATASRSIEWPSGLDPLKRESLSVLFDLIRAENPVPSVITEEALAETETIETVPEPVVEEEVAVEEKDPTEVTPIPAPILLEEPVEESAEKTPLEEQEPPIRQIDRQEVIPQ